MSSRSLLSHSSTNPNCATVPSMYEGLSSGSLSLGVEVTEQANLCSMVNNFIEDVKCQIEGVVVGIRSPGSTKRLSPLVVLQPSERVTPQSIISL